jgi:hypothetical protein
VFALKGFEFESGGFQSGMKDLFFEPYVQFKPHVQLLYKALRTSHCHQGWSKSKDLHFPCYFICVFPFFFSFLFVSSSAFFFLLLPSYLPSFSIA